MMHGRDNHSALKSILKKILVIYPSFEDFDAGAPERPKGKGGISNEKGISVQICPPPPFGTNKLKL